MAVAKRMTQQSPHPNETLLIGEIVGPFGVHGQVKMRSYTDHPDHVRRRIRMVYVGAERRPYVLREVLIHKPTMLILTLGDVTTREAAEALRGQEIAILEREAAPLAQDEYYIHQLYGLTVVTDDGVELGRVREVLTTGANEVLVVARPEQSDALIPMIHEVVRGLDIAGGRVVVHLIDGLLP